MYAFFRSHSFIVCLSKIIWPFCRAFCPNRSRIERQAWAVRAAWAGVADKRKKERNVIVRCAINWSERRGTRNLADLIEWQKASRKKISAKTQHRKQTQTPDRIAIGYGKKNSINVPESILIVDAAPQALSQQQKKSRQRRIMRTRKKHTAPRPVERRKPCCQWNFLIGVHSHVDH